MSPARTSPPARISFFAGPSPGPRQLGISAVSSQWPDATNTGYRNAPGYPGSLTNGTSLTVASNNTYSYYDFPGGKDAGASGSNVSNVTFLGCRFRSDTQDTLCKLYGDNITFSYCSFEPNITTLPVSYANSYQFGLEGAGGFSTTIAQLLVSHCDFFGFGNAIDVNGSTQAKPHTFQHNWLHDQANDGGGLYHTDGIGTEGVGAGTASEQYAVVYHNSLNLLNGNTNALAWQSPGIYDHSQVTFNLFGGDGYTVAIRFDTGGSGNNITFTDNVYTTQYLPSFGPMDGSSTWWTTPATGSLWRRNKWLVPPGAAWGNSSNSGKYWMPVTSTVSGGDDTPYVSVTDYTG